MSFWDGLFIQLIGFLIALGIIYLAYLTTYVPETQIIPTTVLIIDNNRRRLLDRIVRDAANSDTTQSANSYSQTTETDLTQNVLLVQPVIQQTPTLQAIIDEVHDLATAYQENTENAYRVLESLESDIDGIFDEDGDTGLQSIISDMDNPDTPDGLRRRRVNFFVPDLSIDGEPSNNVETSGRRLNDNNINSQSGGDASTDTDNCSNENNENENISKTENVTRDQSEDARCDNSASTSSKLEEFRIKLKYLNDETRLVKANPEEIIGDFKKRNFSVELTAEKLVRLIFNGQILQPETKTLKACGMFDNCVVHCLIHNKKPVTGGQHNSNNGGQQHSNNNVNMSTAGLGQSNTRNSLADTFLDRSSSGPVIVYLGLVAVTFTIIFCWFCRIQYSHLFSWYSTIGLVIMTILFLIMLPIVMLIERDVPT